MNTLLRTLPYALVNAASPTIPVAAIALLALPGRGRRNLWAYFLGCAGTVAVMTILVVAFFSRFRLPQSMQDGLPTWVDALLGVGLVVVGAWLWIRGPRSKTGEAPAWERMGFLPALGVGIYMECINLVTPPAYLTGVVVVTGRQIPTAERIVVIVILALVVLAPVALLLLFAVVQPARTDAWITRLQALGHRYGHRLVIALFLSGGAYFLARWVWDVWFK